MAFTIHVSPHIQINEFIPGLFSPCRPSRRHFICSRLSAVSQKRLLVCQSAELDVVLWASARRKRCLDISLVFCARARAEEKDSRLNFNVGQTPNAPLAFYLLRGYYNENEIPPPRVLTAAAASAVSQRGERHEGGGFAVVG